MRITLDGNIGCGKSTVLKLLRDRQWHAPDGGACLVECVPEPVDAWAPWLDRLYDASYANGAAEFQWRVFLDRCWADPRAHTHARTATVVQCIERSPWAQSNVFVHLQAVSGGLSPPMYELLKEAYRRAWWQPDVMVYLRSSPEECLARMQGRARTSERDVPLDYLQRVHDRHEDEWDWDVLHGKKLPRIAINVEGKSPEAVADAVWNAVRRSLNACWEDRHERW